MRICTVEGCVREVSSKGLCTMHYQRSRNKGSIKDLKRAKFHYKKCNAFGCNEYGARLGLCERHLKEWNFE